MQLSTTKRHLGRLAAILGLIQGTAWAAMSLASIILHNWSPTLTEENTTYTRMIGLLLYRRFIHDTTGSSPFVIRPFDFTIFMWIYFILSVGWVALSIDQLTAIHYDKGRQKRIIFLWGVVTLITSLIDLILTCLLARDYANCTDDSESYVCYLIVGIAMTLSARGFTLWIVNIVLSFAMLSISMKIEKGDKLADWFNNHRIPRIVSKSTKDNSGNRSGNLSPNFPSNESPFPSFFYPNDKFGLDDSLSSFPGRDDRRSDNENKGPSFLSRGDKFGY